jgi:hypothetical protein
MMMCVKHDDDGDEEEEEGNFFFFEFFFGCASLSSLLNSKIESVFHHRVKILSLSLSLDFFLEEEDDDDDQKNNGRHSHGTLRAGATFRKKEPQNVSRKNSFAKRTTNKKKTKNIG